MIEEVKRAGEAALARVGQAATADEVRALEAELLGKRGPFATFKTGLGALATVEEKRAAGQAVNEATTAVAAGLDQRRRELAAAERLFQLAAERLDLT
jgi:phenylalanyl-tRNA synthetase alpha chain